MDIKIIGIYLVESEEPCNLVELEIVNPGSDFEIEEFTQEIPDENRENWQVPYDEHFLNPDGTAVLNPGFPDEVPQNDVLRVVFFFYYIDFEKPFKTPCGDLRLPLPVQKPDRLDFIKYEPSY